MISETKNTLFILYTGVTAVSRVLLFGYGVDNNKNKQLFWSYNLRNP